MIFLFFIIYIRKEHIQFDSTMASFKPICIIEVGCPPGAIRPDKVLLEIMDNIINDSEQTDNLNNNLQEWKKKIDNSTRSFGDYSWSFPSTFSEKEFVNIREIFMKHFTNYYNSGTIRWASISME